NFILFRKRNSHCKSNHYPIKTFRMSLKKDAIKNSAARKWHLSLDSSLPLARPSNVRRFSFNITSIPEDEDYFGDDDSSGRMRTLHRRHSVGVIRVEQEIRPCCDDKIVTEVNEILREKTYVIVTCKESQSGNGFRKWYHYRKFKVICGKGKKSHT